VHACMAGGRSSSCMQRKEDARTFGSLGSLRPSFVRSSSGSTHTFCMHSFLCQEQYDTYSKTPEFPIQCILKGLLIAEPQ